MTRRKPKSAPASTVPLLPPVPPIPPPIQTMGLSLYEKVWGKLSTLPQTQFSAVVTAGLWVATFFWAVGISVLKKNNGEAVPLFNAWLTALTGKTLIGGATYVGKRATFDEKALGSAQNQARDVATGSPLIPKADNG